MSIFYIHFLNAKGIESLSPFGYFYKHSRKVFIYFLFFPFIFISWRLITLQYCSGFCHTLT